MTAVDRVLDALALAGMDPKRNGKGYRSFCPVHESTGKSGHRTPSLSIDQGRQGALIICRSEGCGFAVVAEAIGLSKAELFDDYNSNRGESRMVEVDRYHYLNSDGTRRFDVVRYGNGVDKGFSQQLPDESRGGLGGIEPVLFKLPELVEGIRQNRWIVVVEGEKDVHTLQAAGLVATTNPMGAGKWRASYTESLVGAKVAIIPDNDTPGHDHANTVARALHAAGNEVRVVTLEGLPLKGDVTDWFNAGHTADELKELIDSAPTWEPTEAEPTRNADRTYSPGGIVFDTPSTPESLWGRDAESLAAMGELTLFYAGTGIGKTTLAQRVALSALGIGPDEILGYPVRQLEGRVLYVAADRPVQAMRSLRRMVTIDDRPILDERWLWEHHRRIRITPANPETVHEAAVDVGAQLVILDSIKDLVSEVSLDKSGQAYNDAVQICVANGVEVIALHHPRKATAEGRTRLDLDSVYGSAWITAGAGSVVAFNGAPGTGIAKLQQLKMPSEEVGPFDIDFDYDLGTVTTIGRRDLAQWIYTQGTATSAEAVRYLTGKDEPTDAEKRRVRRKLNRLQTDGEITSTGEVGDMKVWRPTLTIGDHAADQEGRSGASHGGRSPRSAGSVTEHGNVDVPRAEGVGHTRSHPVTGVGHFPPF